MEDVEGTQRCIAHACHDQRGKAEGGQAAYAHENEQQAARRPALAIQVHGSMPSNIVGEVIHG